MPAVIERARRLGQGVASMLMGKGVPLLYFNKITNVGDLVSVYLVETLSGQPVYRATTNALPHISAVGSTIGSASAMSYVWGSGSIDGAAPRRALAPRKITALRGKFTHELLERSTGGRLKVALGDPALLMPRFYDHAVPVEHQIGIVPHFEEYDLIREWLPQGLEGVKLIDVRQEPEPFIDELRSCQTILSSSLHGLILADAYEVPNVWFSASSRLLGARWKFMDYFSATRAVGREPIPITDAAALAAALQANVETARCSPFDNSLDDLVSAFPAHYRRRA